MQIQMALLPQNTRPSLTSARMVVACGSVRSAPASRNCTPQEPEAGRQHLEAVDLDRLAAVDDAKRWTGVPALQRLPAATSSSSQLYGSKGEHE